MSKPTENETSPVVIDTCRYPVRLYFTSTIRYLVPTGVGKDRNSIESFFWSLDAEVHDYLGADFDAPAYKRHKKIGSTENLYEAVYSISKLFEFKSSELQNPDSLRTGLPTRLKKRTFTRAKNAVEARLATLANHYFVSKIEFSFATSRVFFYETSVQGEMEFERAFSPAEIRDAGGVRQLLTDLWDEIDSELGSYLGVNCCSTLGSSPPSRRTANNRYCIQFSYSSQASYVESEMVGHFSIIDGEMPYDEVYGWIEPRDNNNEYWLEYEKGAVGNFGEIAGCKVLRCDVDTIFVLDDLPLLDLDDTSFIA